MHISILGAGHAGTAVAADLSLRGHEVALIKTSHAMHDESFNYLLENGGRVCLVEDGEEKCANIAHVTRDLSCVSESEVVIMFIQSNYHEALIKRMRPYFRDGQILLINPGYLSTAYVLKHCPDVDLTVVEAESSFIDCRITQSGTITVTFRNVRNPLGVYPQSRRERTEAVLNQLGFPFVYLRSVAEAALHNPNLIVHTVGAIMSIPRIEKTNGEYYMYREVFTPSVWRILEALDNEKMNVMEKMGFERLPYVEACKLRNTLDDSRDAKEVFFWYANLPNPLKGPTVVDSRFISEDVPQGLVFLESLGQEYNVATPVCTALIEIASAALNRDLRQEGRTVERLGRDVLKRILQEAGE
ncbi:MAG: NAD/NADP octopine/nopaline dehydrogenase family protein [Oscillospiraceae bacterium]|jgi:opine dehydrogenase